MAPIVTACSVGAAAIAVFAGVQIFAKRNKLEVEKVIDEGTILFRIQHLE